MHLFIVLSYFVLAFKLLKVFSAGNMFLVYQNSFFFNVFFNIKRVFKDWKKKENEPNKPGMYMVLFFFLRFFFFWCGPFLKSSLNLLQHCFCFMFWSLAMRHVEIYLSSLTRIETATPAPLHWKAKVLTTELPGKGFWERLRA